MGWKFGQTFETTVVSNVLNYVCIYIYIYICSNQQLRYPFLSSTFNCNRNGQFKKEEEEEEEKKKGYTNFKPHFKAARQRKEIQRAPKEDI